MPDSKSILHKLTPGKRALLAARIKKKSRKQSYIKKIPSVSENAMLSEKQNSSFQSYINGVLYVKEFPRYLHIELTNACNLKCIMCPHKTMTRKTGYMDFDLFKKVIDESSGNVDFICLYFYGESFLHKKIFEFIEYASGRGITLNLSTNATLLSPGVIDQLLQSKLDCLVLSIDSLTKSNYEKIRVSGDFKKVMNSVNELLYKHKITESDLNICCQIIKMDRNTDEIGAFKKEWEVGSGVKVLVKPLEDLGGQVDDIDGIGFVDRAALTHKTTCPEPWRMLVVGWDGNVAPCCFDYDFKYIYGNIKDSSLREIWNSQRMRSFRKLHKEMKRHAVELCKTCSFLSLNAPDSVGHIPIHIRFNPSILLTQYYSSKGNYGFEPPDFQTIWTQKEFEFPVQDRFRDVRFVFCNENPDHGTLQMKVKLFQKDVGIFAISEETEIFLKTPDNYKGRLLRYEFRLDHDWTPKEKEMGDDSRKLGVRIKNIIN
ncbi:conserved hypothetical protein [Candidatus Desulfarcum epimagneticum]|uniref:Radical SAM core domain-containing protein n=1 Tax=uncultured Desulfobacteraceae bacterium TaxID=218296 RepID=A0A484HHB9_9BACT|nr:conserved hypothetical protein [uncultured Desulfobacteraceae bacterium]